MKGKDDDSKMETPIVVKQKMSGNILYSFGALVFSLSCLLLVFIDFRSAGGFVGALTRSFLNYIILKVVLAFGFLFFMYIFLYLLKRAKQGKDILIVDEKGITDNSSALSIGFIPWQDIDGIYIDSIYGNAFIEIVLHNEEQYINRLTKLKRKAVCANKKMGHQIVCITLNSTGVAPHELLPSIQARFEEAKMIGCGDSSVTSIEEE